LFSLFSLSEAKYVCKQLSDCGGITLANGEFELRQGNTPTDSPDSEQSWIKGTYEKKPKTPESEKLPKNARKDVPKTKLETVEPHPPNFTGSPDWGPKPPKNKKIPKEKFPPKHLDIFDMKDGPRGGIGWHRPGHHIDEDAYWGQYDRSGPPRKPKLNCKYRETLVVDEKQLAADYSKIRDGRTCPKEDGNFSQSFK